MATEKYLELLAELFGFETREVSPAFENAPGAETYEELKSQISDKGIELGEYGELGDGIWCVWEDGVLKVTAYISSRGRLFQTGAYDGEKAYFAHNVVVPESLEPQGWQEEPLDTMRICAKIAKEAWEEIEEK